ncbi:MAG: tetratricopeptide repeat protein [Anaerolineae bacterium]
MQKHLNGKRSLVVLDDVWHEGLKEQFSLAGIDLRLVVTTRQKRLVDNPETVDKLSADEGLRLLATLFNPANPDPASLTADHRAIVTELDGYTLAVEIAGKWLIENEATPAYYLQKLHSTESALFDDPDLQLSESDKNKNLALSLSLSYNALKPDDQRRFRALGIFAPNSSFSLKALSALWEMDDAQLAAQTLVKLGLLEKITPAVAPSSLPAPDIAPSEIPSPVYGGGSGRGLHEDLRYTQHTLLRAYARALLGREKETSEAQKRHFAFYAVTHGTGDNTDLDRFDGVAEDFTNIQTALTWGFTHSPELACDVVNHLDNYLLVRESTATRLDLMKKAHQAATDINYVPGQANTLRALGDLSVRLDELEAAKGYYDRALPIYEQIGDRLGQANTLIALGDLSVRLAELEAAKGYYDRALPIYEQIGDRLGQANTLRSVGNLLQAQQQWNEAILYFEASLKICQIIHDDYTLGIALTDMLPSLVALGQHENALKNALTALQIDSDRNLQQAVRVDINTIRKLKQQIGVSTFDTAWQNVVGQPQPDWLSDTPTSGTSSEDQAAQAFARLYREQGEAALLAALQDMGAPPDAIQQIIEVIKGMDTQ